MITQANIILGVSLSITDTRWLLLSPSLQSVESAVAIILNRYLYTSFRSVEDWLRRFVTYTENGCSKSSNKKNHKSNFYKSVKFGNLKHYNNFPHNEVVPVLN
jgi:hypothetical protein